MKNNYFLGFLLAIIFPGLIQYYIGEKTKAARYIFWYLMSFLILFVFVTLKVQTIDTSNMNSIMNNELLLQLSLAINIIFRILSGYEGLVQLRKRNR